MSPTASRPAAGGPVAGIVLAGGRSLRFGRDKLRAEYRGAPLLHHAVVRLAELCDEVIVVIAPDADEPGMPPGVPVRFARDAVGGAGPLSGARAGLDATGVQRAILVGGDMPDIRLDVLREMLRAADETGADAVVLSDEGVARPLPCVVKTVPTGAAAAALLEAGRKSLRDLLASVSTVVIDEPSWTGVDPQKETLFDVDEPADLDR